jgi:hypothetical protein
MNWLSARLHFTKARCVALLASLRRLLWFVWDGRAGRDEGVAGGTAVERMPAALPKYDVVASRRGFDDREGNRLVTLDNQQRRRRGELVGEVLQGG